MEAVQCHGYRLHEGRVMPSFIDIYEDVLEPDVCKEIIRRFEEDTENQYQGVVAQGVTGGTKVNLEQKACTELSISFHPNWKDIDDIVFKAVGKIWGKAQEAHPGLERLGGLMVDEGYRIKRYMPGGHEFFNVHADCGGFAQAHRQLVQFIYLNDVEEGGETEFPEFGIKVQPREGMMVTFPPFWTHEHIGHPPISGPKYAVTSWMTFPRTDKKLTSF